MWPNIIKSHIIDSMYCIYLRNYSIPSILYDVVYCVSPLLILPQFHSSFSRKGASASNLSNEELWTRSLLVTQKTEEKKTCPWGAGGFFLGNVFIIPCFVFCVKPMLSSKQERKKIKVFNLYCIAIIYVYVQKPTRKCKTFNLSRNSM